MFGFQRNSYVAKDKKEGNQGENRSTKKREKEEV
jgi:hypothetical protein